MKKWIVALLPTITLACGQAIPTRLSPLPDRQPVSIAAGAVIHSSVGVTDAWCDPRQPYEGVDPLGEDAGVARCAFFRIAIPSDGTLVVRVEPGTDVSLTLDRGPVITGSSRFVELQAEVSGGSVHDIQVGFRHHDLNGRAFTLTTAMR